MSTRWGAAQRHRLERSGVLVGLDSPLFIDGRRTPNNVSQTLQLSHNVTTAPKNPRDIHERIPNGPRELVA
jgi:hypothetical protein